MEKRQVYLDYSATTPLKDEVLQAMMPYLTGVYGNASSFHQFGRAASKAIEESRARMSAALHGEAGRFYFTSGGTEADNWAIKGMAKRRNAPGRHVITSAIEHHAVLHSCQALEAEGFTVTYLPVDETGMVSPQALEAAIRPDTCLVSIMMINNEVGTVQPIRDLAAVAHAHGVPFHTDAVQAVGSVDVNIADLDVDLLSLSAHKFYGPKGVGALYVRKGIVPQDFMAGGAQEFGHRAGTYHTAGIVGMAEALCLAVENLPGHTARLQALRDRLVAGLLQLPHTQLNGHPTQRHPGNASISFGGIEGEGLLLRLDLSGVAASSGSACTSGSTEPSHVLLAMHIDEMTAQSTVRFTLGDGTSEEDVDYTVAVTRDAVEKLRAMSPIYDNL